MGLLEAGGAALLEGVEEAMEAATVAVGAVGAGMEVVMVRPEEEDTVAASEGVEAGAMLLIELQERLTSGGQPDIAAAIFSKKGAGVLYHYFENWHLGWAKGITLRTVEQLWDGLHGVESTNLQAWAEKCF